MMDFQLNRVPLLSRVGADRADQLRTDIDGAVAGWPRAALLRVDERNQVLIADHRVVLTDAAEFAETPPPDAVLAYREWMLRRLAWQPG